MQNRIGRSVRTVLQQQSQRHLSHNHITPFQTRYGPGGRSSNSGITATVFGAYGFVGRYFLNELGACGSRVYVPFRGCELEVRHLKPMFDLGQLGLLPYSPRDESSIIESLRSSDIVINLIGKHYETKHVVPTRRADGKLSRVNYSFDQVHADIPRTIARLAKEAGVKSFIHVSSLSADLESESLWSQSKAKGEAAVREEFPDATIVKLATVFGPEDRFLNWIAESTARLPVSPLLKGGSNLVQPVYSVDVGKALMNIVYEHKKFAGATFQFVGPAEYSYKEVVEFVSDVTGVKKTLVDIPLPVAKLIGTGLQETMNPFFSVDTIAQLSEDVVLKDDASLLTLADLDVVPVSMDKVAFDYLHRFRPGGHFTVVQGYH